MINEVNIPREGDLHSVVTIGPYSFELRYGYCDERDRASGEPYILYPDLLSNPLYTEEGYRIVAALQSICQHYAPLDGQEREDCCYTCRFYPDQQTEIGICGCEQMRRGRRRSEMKRKILLILLCIMFLGIAGYFGVRLYRDWSEYRAGETAYEALAQHVYLDPSPTEERIMKTQKPVSSATTDMTECEQESSTESEDRNWPTVNFEALQTINPDVVAWIIVEGTNINYPVVQGSDNREYLYRLVDGSSNSAGSIFMDYRNGPDFSGRNTVLYGHHMKNETMFGSIVNYKEQSFYDEHPTCLILTPEGNYTLEFFAGYVANLNGDAWKLEFESDEEYGLWLEQAMDRSTFRSSIIPAPQERVVTLSTCSYEYNDARYVLLGRLTAQS